jgi:hypothetical protein
MGSVYTGLVSKPLGTIAAAILTAALVTANGFLIFDAFFREQAQHALMNVEGVIALSFVALLYARSGASLAMSPKTHFDYLAIASVIGAVALAFFPILRTPFLYDDYSHITDVSHTTWRTILQEFGRVSGKGVFFRPLGFFFYWLNYLWGGASATWWHASNVALHVACSVLVYVLCREVGLSWSASLGGSLLFGLTGAAAESVAWIDAGFVTLTTLPILMSLIFVCRYVSTGRTAWLGGALAAGLCAMLCKETAFSLPFLIASLTFFKDRADWGRIARATGLATLLTAVLFVYRWWALNGIGGYASSGGDANILHFSVVRTLDALFLRQWAVLFFPFNWTIMSHSLARVAVAASPLLFALCAWSARLPRRALAGCVVFIVTAALPVEHLLLISPDLGGSRTLYLGSVGWALLWAFVLGSMHPTARVAAICLLVALECLTLEHNLVQWRQTSELARSVCTAFGQKVAGTSGPVVVSGLPAIRNGAVFLQNGFPQCVEMNAGVPASRIHVGDSEMMNAGAKEFRWNEATGRIE